MASIEPHLVQMLLGYWKNNPFACDTPEGIQRWWLPDEANCSLSEVNSALLWLMQQGVVEPLPASDQRIRYRRRADASNEDMRTIEAELLKLK